MEKITLKKPRHQKTKFSHLNVVQVKHTDHDRFDYNILSYEESGLFLEAFGSKVGDAQGGYDKIVVKCSYLSNLLVNKVHRKPDSVPSFYFAAVFTNIPIVWDEMEFLISRDQNTILHAQQNKFYIFRNSTSWERPKSAPPAWLKILTGWRWFWSLKRMYFRQKIIKCSIRIFQSFPLPIFFAEGIFGTLDTTWEAKKLRKILLAFGIFGLRNFLASSSENSWSMQEGITKILDNHGFGFSRNAGLWREILVLTFWKRCLCRNSFANIFVELAFSKDFGVCKPCIKLYVLFLSQCRKTS